MEEYAVHEKGNSFDHIYTDIKSSGHSEEMPGFREAVQVTGEFQLLLNETNLKNGLNVLSEYDKLNVQADFHQKIPESVLFISMDQRIPALISENNEQELLRSLLEV